MSVFMAGKTNVGVVGASARRREVCERIRLDDKKEHAVV